MSVSSGSVFSISGLVTDNEVKMSLMNKQRAPDTDTESDDLDSFLTDNETKLSVLTHRMSTPSPQSLKHLPPHDKEWWSSKHWRAEVDNPLIAVDDPIDSLPSTALGDTGSSCASDADKLPSVITPSTFCGSSAGSHLTSISKIMERSNSGLGSLGEVSTVSNGKRKYNTMKNGKRNEVGSRETMKAKRRLIVSSDALSTVLSSSCCNNKCLQEHLVFCDLNQIRQSVESLSCAERNQVVMQCIGTGLKRDTVDGRHMFPLPNGKSVCAHATALVYGISIRTFRSLTGMVKKGLFSSIRLPRSRGTNVWKTYLVPFLEDYAKEYGAVMPHTRKTELSVGAKSQIYYKFKVLAEGVPELTSRQLSIGWFYKLWKLFCPDIICPKRNTFTKCDQCCLFKEAIEKLSDRRLRVQAVEKFDTHLMHQMLERKQYYENRMHAIRHPAEAVSMIIDGMAQHTTNLPVFPVGRPKSTSMLQTYDLHAMGVLIHGYNPVVYVHDSTVPTGPNMLCEVLWRAIKSLPVEKLPPVLYLQLDNTASDNKNHWVLEFCSMLVQQRVFKEVKLGFMMVGHTHDDVDQMFSRFSVRLKNYNKAIVSLPHFFTVLINAYTPTPRCEFMFQCMDWKSWLDQFSFHHDGTALHGHLRPHQFHFLLSSDENNVKMIWKRWARDDIWFPVNNDSPDVCLLARECCFDNIGVVDPRIPEADDVDSVTKMFNVAKKFVPAEEYILHMEHLKDWMAGIHKEQTAFKPISLAKKWGMTPSEFANAASQLLQPDDMCSEHSITREDIDTSDEDLVYQGKAHSTIRSRVRHKDNFVAVEGICDNQFLLVRGHRNETDEVWLCKVHSVDSDCRTLSVQWYGGKSINHAQHPELARDQGSTSGGKKKSKNSVFYQDISLDTVLVSEPFTLTNSKTIPKAKVKIATQRLLAFQKYTGLKKTTHDSTSE